MQSAKKLVVHDTDRVLSEVSSSSISISIGSIDDNNVPNPLNQNNNNNHKGGDIDSYDRFKAEKIALKSKAEKVATSKSKNKKYNNKKETTSGRWTSEEHNQFMHGLKLYGKEWKLVSNCIPTRTSAQIRSHAQKYFAKMSKDQQETVESTEQQTNLSSRAKQQQQKKTLHSTEQQTICSREDTTEIETKVVNTLASLRDRYQHLEDRLQAKTTPNHLVQTSSPATAALKQEQTYLRQAAQARYEMKRFTEQKKQSDQPTVFVSLSSFPSQNGGFSSSDVLELSQMGTSLKRGPPLTNTNISIIKDEKDEESFKKSLKLVRDHLEMNMNDQRN